MNNMKTKYRLIYRGIRGGKFYAVEKTTGKRTSLYGVAFGTLNRQAHATLQDGVVLKQRVEFR